MQMLRYGFLPLVPTMAANGTQPSTAIDLRAAAIPTFAGPERPHAGRLLPEYQARSPSMVAWARACFEQGALPSLLLLQGLVPIFTLPGDKMFQSTGVQPGRHRPPIIHAYGGVYK